MARTTRSKRRRSGRAKGTRRRSAKGKPARDEAADRRAIAEEYFRLIGRGRFEDGLKYFAPSCRTHNPYIAGDIAALTKAMAEANAQMGPGFTDPAFTVDHVLVDGDLVAVHTNLLGARTNPGEGGLRQVHLFRFEGDKIVEYWDVTQMVTRDHPNAAGAF